MSKETRSPVTFTAGEALEAFRRVKLTAASTTVPAEVEYADAADSNAFVGWTLQKVDGGAPVGVLLKQDATTIKAVASAAITRLATLYAANDGKVSASATGNAIGTALEAATANNDVIEILADYGDGSVPGPLSVQNESATNGALPFLISADLVNATGSSANLTVIEAMPRRGTLARAWLVSRDTNAANLTLRNDGTAMTAAQAKGTANQAVVDFAQIVAAEQTVPAGDEIDCTVSADCSVTVYLLFIPVVTP